MTRRNLVLVVLLGVAAVAALGYAALRPMPGTPEAQLGMDPANAELVALGRKVYAAHCASCHGERLQGEANWRRPKPDGTFGAPPHDASGHTWHHADTLLFRITKDGGQSVMPQGRKSNMPGVAETLSDRDIWASLAYIKSRWPEEIRRRHDQINQASR